MFIVMMSEPVFLCKKNQPNKLVGLLIFPGTGAAPLLNAGCLVHSTSFEKSAWPGGGDALSIPAHTASSFLPCYC